MRKWEYKTAIHKGWLLDDLLNEYGEDGWELVSVNIASTGPDGLYCVFKREVE